MPTLFGPGATTGPPGAPAVARRNGAIGRVRCRGRRRFCETKPLGRGPPLRACPT